MHENIFSKIVKRLNLNSSLPKLISWLIEYFLKRGIFLSISIILSIIGLIIPSCTLILMNKSNNILQKQTEWYIKNDTRHNYYLLRDRINNPSKFSNDERQDSFDELIGLTLEFQEFTIDRLDLRDLRLNDFYHEGNIRIHHSIITGDFLPSLETYKYSFIETKFNKVRIEPNYVKKIKEMKFHDVTIENSFISDLYIEESLFTGTLKGSILKNITFCGSEFNMSLDELSSLDTVSFHCPGLYSYKGVEPYKVLRSLIFPKKISSSLGSMDFQGVTLINIDFSYADLTNVSNLDKAMAFDVCGNDETKWPSNYAFPNCNRTKTPY